MSEQIKAIAASTEVELNVSPFMVQNPTEWNGASGTEVYGVNLPGRDARNGNYQRFIGDGSTVAWTEVEVVNLANAPVTMTDETDQLDMVVMVNGEVLPREIETSAPTTTAGKWLVYDDSGDTTLVFGTAPAEGAKVEIFINGTIQNITIPATGIVEGPAPQVVIASAAVTAVRLTR